MEPNTIQLESGKEYILAQLFSGAKKIIIPDLQRDYCWGDKAWNKDKKIYKELVSDFVENLIISFDGYKKLGKNADQDNYYLTLGLIYGYETPKYHIQLCDGQQRITTLFLLLGMLNRHTENNDFQKYLIPELKQDDKETYLQYAIRESTVYFLGDLVYKFFINKDISTEQIKNQNWYFKEYDLDASIQSMLASIKIIDDKINEIENCLDFGKFIAEKLQIIYYDMGSRTRGEETFVVINTTGEPLTVTENLKPKIIGSFTEDKDVKMYSAMWEKWEGFFWKNRPQNHNTSDTGLNEFFRWIYIIENTKTDENYFSEKEKYNTAQIALVNNSFDLLTPSTDKTELLENIDSYFVALKKLKTDDYCKKLTSKDENLSQIDCFRLLPLLTFVKLFNIETIEGNRDFLRLFHFVRSRAHNENVGKTTITAVLEVVKLVKLLLKNKNSDILTVLNFSDKISETLFDKTEKYKFSVLKSNSNREEIENAFWKAERDEICKGDIKYLLDVLNINIQVANITFNVDDFTRAYKIAKATTGNPTDIIRRAMLCFGDYKWYDGWTPSLASHRYSFGNNSDFYRNILQKNDTNQKKIMMNFLLSIFNDKDINIDEKLSALIKAGVKTDFITGSDPKLSEEIIKNLIENKDGCWEFMGYKNIAIKNGDGKIIYLLLQQKVTGDGTYREFK